MPAILLAGGLLIVSLGGQSSACINEYTSGPPVRKERPSDYISRLEDHPEHDRLRKGPAPQDPGAAADFKLRNNYAAALVHRGQAKTAVEILDTVEREHPGEYIVAANLGTAYELSGDLVQAEQWISEGIRRNPQAHEGTEWLHVRILQARQALAKDPAWLKTHSVLGLNFGPESFPRVPSAWPTGAHDAEDVIAALAYQLHERLAFVPAPDPLVGGMIADLANLLLPYRNASFAIPIYKLALAYQAPEAELLARRLETCELSRRIQSRTDLSKAPYLGGIAALTLLGAAFLVWRRRTGIRILSPGRNRTRMSAL